MVSVGPPLLTELQLLKFGVLEAAVLACVAVVAAFLAMPEHTAERQLKLLQDAESAVL
jgi:hypothetical protein